MSTLNDLVAAEADCIRLEAALLRLANEVRATMSLAEQAVREAAGNTNYQCLMEAESEARVALRHSSSMTPTESKP